MDEMFSGVPGQGANDAAYKTALLVEQCILKKEDYTGGAADVYKCFDQVQRPLMYEILRKGGMPETVLSAYTRFLEQMEVRNTVVGGIGEPYKRPTGIPQGDPFSMMVTAMMMRPWLVQMKQAAVVPRILADDLQILARGANRLNRFENASDATHKHLYDMGARVAPKKSVVF